MRKHLTYANVMATLALVVAVAGGTTAVAVSKKKAGGAPVRVTKASDIGKKGNIKAARVTSTKLASGAVSAAQLADGSVGASKMGPIDVVRASGPGSATATCPAGQRLLAGGVDASGSPVTVSIPDLPPGGAGNGWFGGAQTASSVQTFALCLR